MRRRRFKEIPTLNLNAKKGKHFYKFIETIRCETGCYVDHGSQTVENLTRSEFLYDVDVKDWVFVVKLEFGDRVLEVLIQRHKLYLVGYKVKHGRWIVLKGQFTERVLQCLDVSFRAYDATGNLLEPCEVQLGTSYRSMESWGSGARGDLKLNKNTLTNAICGLQDASLGLLITKKNSVHIMSLTQMIPEAVRIEEMQFYISQHYFSDDSDTPTLSASPIDLIQMQQSWTRASRFITNWTYGEENQKFLLHNDPCPYDVQQVINMYPYIRAVTFEDLKSD